MNKVAYIFRGPPASGKGTIVGNFIKTLGSPTALLEEDAFRWRFHLVNRTIPEITEADHALAYKNLLSVLENYLASGKYSLVVEGLFSWSSDGPHGKANEIKELCERHGYKTYTILLHGDYDTLFARNNKRDYAVPKEEFDELYHYVMDDQPSDDLKIDVSRNISSDSLERLSALN